jgi:AcrR family transcriptional regulator
VPGFDFAIEPAFGAGAFGEAPHHGVFVASAADIGPGDLIDCAGEPNGFGEGVGRLRAEASDVTTDCVIAGFRGWEQLVWNGCPVVATFFRNLQDRLGELGFLVVERFAIARDEGIEVGRQPDPFWDAVGHAGDDYAAVAVATQQHIVEFLELEDRDRVVDVVGKGNFGRAQVCAFAEASEGGGIDLVAAGTQFAGNGSPFPAASPSAVNGNDSRHAASSFHGGGHPAPEMIVAARIDSTIVRPSIWHDRAILSIMTTAMDTDGEPRRRSDGEQTHAAILDTAMRIASIEGLGSLTIGRLARELGISKSGVFAHFQSKQRLQEETIAAARRVLEREVIGPGLGAPSGLAQLEALCESYLSYVERRVFPGGCFFAHIVAEFDAQEGAIHDQVAAGQLGWTSLLDTIIETARQQGELRTNVDGPQLAFELYAAMELANYLSVLYDHPGMVDRGRAAVRGAIERAASR